MSDVLPDLLASALASYLVHGTMIGLGLTLAAGLFARPATRVWLYRTAILAPAVTMSIAGALPYGAAPLRWVRAAPAIDAAQIAARSNGKRLRITRGTGGFEYAIADSRGRTVQPPSPMRGGVAWQPLAAIGIWLLGALFMSVRFARAFREHLARVKTRTTAPVLREDLWALGLRSWTVRVTTCHTLAGPVALAGGEICMPADLIRSLPVDARRAIVAHEAAHVMRRDPAWSVALEIVKVVAWFQPVVWLAARAARRDAELACDDWAVRRGGSEALAFGLTVVAEQALSSPLASAAGEQGAFLIKRVERALEISDEPPRRPLLAVAAILLAIASTWAWVPRIVISAPEHVEVKAATQSIRVPLPR